MLKKYKNYIILTIITITTMVYFVSGEDYSKQTDIIIDSIEEVDGKIDNTAEKHFVTHIVDGDTFDISTGERVRMIGIDTPERGKYFYNEATEHLRGFIENREVTLTRDVSETDKYGRILRHVYVDDVWINEQMIKDGFARFVTFPPDVAHVDVFSSAQKYAKENKLGLWAGK